MGQMLPHLAVVAGGAGRDEGFGNAGGKRLRQLGGLDLDRRHAELLGEGRGGRVIGTELHALRVGRRADRLLEVEALARPRAGVERDKIQAVELCVHLVLGGRPQLAVGLVGGGQERQVVPAQKRGLVGMCRHEALADRRLAGLHGALDLAALEKRSAGMDGDVDLAARVVTDLVGEHDAHLGMEVGRGIGHRHIPLFGKGGRGRQRHGGGCGHPDHFLHWYLSLCYRPAAPFAGL